jgi:hypothetical protein
VTAIGFYFAFVASHWKAFEHLLMRESLIGVVIRPSYLMRAGVVAVTIAAWFLISNHCAFAIVEGAKLPAEHAHCHGSTAPTNAPAQNEQLPCCKLLRATITKDGASVAGNALAFSLQPYFVGFIVFPEPLRWPQSFELDTGPPFSISFAESVLQRSILAHAPPSFLS